MSWSKLSGSPKGESELKWDSSGSGRTRSPFNSHSPPTPTQLALRLTLALLKPPMSERRRRCDSAIAAALVTGEYVWHDHTTPVGAGISHPVCGVSRILPALSRKY